ncbi:MAG: type I restriction endonuclease subunit R, partial [Chloroflexi bacterium]|nr:type I restriction endonuclease subunit R [Chloroflexota bacterium]
QAAQQPYLISIGERAEEIARAFEERQANAEEALRQLEDLLREYRQAEAARQETNLSPEGFAVYWYLKQQGVTAAEERAREVGEILVRFPHWQVSSQQEREVRQGLYRTLIKARLDGLVAVVDRLLAMLRRVL